MMNDTLAATDEEPEVLSLVVVPGLESLDPVLFVPLLVLSLRVLLIAIPLTEFLVALLGKVAFVVVST